MGEWVITLLSTVCMLETSIKGGYMCILVADSFCCSIETNNIVKQLYSSKN